MIDGLPPEAPAIEAPAIVQAAATVERKRRPGRSRGAVVPGTIILLPDGTECRVVGEDAQGNLLCEPLPPPG